MQGNRRIPPRSRRTKIPLGGGEMAN